MHCILHLSVAQLAFPSWKLDFSRVVVEVVLWRVTFNDLWFPLALVSRGVYGIGVQEPGDENLLLWIFQQREGFKQEYGGSLPHMCRVTGHRCFAAWVRFHEPPTSLPSYVRDSGTWTERVKKNGKSQHVCTHRHTHIHHYIHEAGRRRSLGLTIVIHCRLVKTEKQVNAFWNRCQRQWMLMA